MSSIRRGAGVFFVGLAAGVAGMLACGTNSYVNTGGEAADADASELAAEGQPCVHSTECASHLCLLIAISPDAQADAGAPLGLCSAGCTTSSECGDAGICVPEPLMDGGTLDQGGACYRSCAAASDCAEGIPCIWQPSFDAGICEPLSASFCQDLASMGPCQQCLGANCCAAATACAEDVPCAESLTHPGLGGESALEQALAICAAEGGSPDASCAEACR
jgi:hypothetical protein